MAATGTDTLDTASLQALLGPQLTAEQARLIYEQDPEAVVFALLTLAKRLAERSANPAAATRDPSAPSGQTPPYVKPTRQGRAKPKGGRPGHPGHRRPTPTHIDRREEHALTAGPKCHGPVRPLRLTEFIKAGGSAKCLTLRLDSEEAAGWRRAPAAVA